MNQIDGHSAIGFCLYYYNSGNYNTYFGFGIINTSSNRDGTDTIIEEVRMQYSPSGCYWGYSPDNTVKVYLESTNPKNHIYMPRAIVF